MNLIINFVIQSTFIMSEKDYLKDISEIKDIMNKSSRFISLSGLSGILAGIYALVGAAIAYLYIIPKNEYIVLHSWNFKFLILILGLIALLSILTAILLTYKKAKKNQELIWDSKAKRVIINFLIPLITGGIYIIIKLNSQHYGLTASLMLIFYGLALVNVSKYTLGKIKYLGYAEIIVGLFCAQFPGYGFWFWIIGFGFFHIIYGSYMHLSEKRQ